MKGFELDYNARKRPLRSYCRYTAAIAVAPVVELGSVLTWLGLAKTKPLRVNAG